MTFDEWWEDFVAEHDDWKYADSKALRRAAFQAGAANRDAEVVSLTNQRDYEYVRAENAEQERDQLREQVKMLRDALAEVLDGETQNGEDVLAIIHNARETLAATEQKE